MDDRTLSGMFPFLKSVSYIYRGLSLKDLFSSSAYSDARTFAYSVIMKNLGEGDVIYPTSYEMKYLGYHMVRMILAYLNDKILTGRVAIFFRDYFETNFISIDDREVMKRVSAELDVEIMIQGNEFSINVFDYISNIERLGDDYRLFYQRLKNGYVIFSGKGSREKVTKILRESFYRKFIESVESIESIPEEMILYYREELARIKEARDENISKYSTVEYGDIDEDSFPPCIKEIIKRIMNGENVSHNARFTLVTFLKQIGFSSERILEIFRNVPDFDMRMTEYQVKHITGEKGKTVYSVPKCSTIELYGLCVRDKYNDSLCRKEWMTHPLIYYRFKKRSKGSPGPQDSLDGSDMTKKPNNNHE
ncbi:MAG: hypothetical protein ACP5RZ_04090 [Thermoplasmata archaeon]